MKTRPTIQELQADRDEALRPLGLLTNRTPPDFLQGLDPDALGKALRQVDMPWGDEGLYPEAARLLAAIRQTEEGLRLCLETELSHLRGLASAAGERTLQGPLGLIETAFPVRARGVTVHCLWSGKLRDRPFTPAEIDEIARLSGSSRAAAAELASAVPVLEKDHIERLFAMGRRLRDALEQHLEAQVRAAELTRQLLESERALSLGTLSGGVAHHFNNLLSVILGYSSYVLNRESLSRDASDALRKINDAAQRGRRLTEEILAFLGSEAEEVKPCRVQDVLRQVLSLLESQAGTAIQITTRFEADHDTVLSAPSSIRQIVFNLLTNAIDSLPNGGRLLVSTSNTTVEDSEAPRLFLQMDVEEREPGRPAGTGAQEGDSPQRMSLKLSSMYGMVSRLEGSVLITGETGGHVRVLLPVASGDEADLAAAPSRKRPIPSRIWVVDDDPIFREMCRQVLSDGGHTVEELASGRAFRDLWREGKDRPDLIIMDFSMPEYNGLQLCEWLRAEGARAPVVLVSGFAATQPDIRKALRLKRTFFLQKPFSFREMTDVVTVAMGETLIGE